jgi:hypothetical protein
MKELNRRLNEENDEQRLAASTSALERDLLGMVQISGPEWRALIRREGQQRKRRTAQWGRFRSSAMMQAVAGVRLVQCEQVEDAVGEDENGEEE